MFLMSDIFGGGRLQSPFSTLDEGGKQPANPGRPIPAASFNNFDE